MKKILLAVVLFVLVVLLPYWYVLNDRHYKKVIPAELKLKATLYSNSDYLPPRESCGVHVYELAQETLDAINTEGLTFLNTAKQSRGYTDYYHSFSEWRRTPRHDWTRPENWVYELNCSSLSADLQQKIITPSQSPGSFYTLGQEKVLTVIPEYGIIVFTHNG